MMNIRLAGASALAALTISAASVSAGPETYTLDPSHTSVAFKVRHMMVSDVKGTFDNVEGTLAYDADKVENSTVNVTIQTASVNTRNEKRDADLRSDSYLESDKFPTITFVSKKVAKTANGMSVSGDLTIHGVTKEVTIPFTMVGPNKTPWGSSLIGASGSFQISRKDFGITNSQALETGGFVVADEVKIEIEVEFGKKS